MARLRAIPALLATSLLLVVAGVGGSAQAAPQEDDYSLALFAAEPEFDRIVDLALIPGQPDEAIVATQQDALLWRISLSGAFSPVLYGDLSALAGGSGGEEGLLSVIFSPEFQTDGRVYVYYTQGSPDASVLARFDATATDLDESSQQVILEVPQFEDNHNGGRVLFGPDDYLYLSLGDGGGSGDPAETGQDNTDLQGSIIRIEVTGETTYSVPPDNPFVDAPGADEVWAYGMRNPWRFSFDSITGELWLADVGQGDWEEVEQVVKGGNYGWDCYEGFAVYEPAGCPASGFEFPRAVYDHGLGCSVTGGYVYRGARLPELNGWYVYGDYCSGRIWAVDPDDSGDPVQLLDSSFQISSFAELPDGELLVLTFQDAIYQLECDDAIDADGDGVGDPCDNCPGWPNPGQGLPPWPVPPDDPDCDGWDTADEGSIGTDPDDSCGVAAWPPDFNDDLSVDIFDVNILKPAIFSTAPGPPYDVRLDLLPDGSIDIFDVNLLKPPFFLDCEP